MSLVLEQIDMSVESGPLIVASELPDICRICSMPMREDRTFRADGLRYPVTVKQADGDKVYARSMARCHCGHTAYAWYLVGTPVPERPRRREFQIPARTSCEHGHPYNDKNVGTDRRGYQYCKECKRQILDRALRKSGQFSSKPELDD